jgi:predicted phage terminase large subunit-like protein
MQTVEELDRILESLRKIPSEKLAFSNLLSYSALMFNDYKVAPHNAKMAEKLMAVERGEITRLMIFTPPRHGKTLLTSEFFPAWYLGRNPSNQIIASTYSFDRASDVGRKVRNQLIDPLYREVFPDCGVASDSKSAHKLSTLQGGNYYSVGIGGAITGRGADLFLIDDPIKSREDAESEISQRRLRDWFQSVAYTRLMPGKSAMVLIMTRWSYYDLAGFLLEEKAEENWEILNLPAIAEDDDVIDRERGEALWPEKYPVQRLNQIKVTVGTRDWTSMYQQRPIPEEGGMVKLDWFNRYTFKDKRDIDYNSKMAKHIDVRRKTETWSGRPESTLKEKERFAKAMSDQMLGKQGRYFTKIVASWDTAFKVSDLNDPTACTIWGITNDNLFYLLWIVNKRLEYPDLLKEAMRVHSRNCEFYKMRNSQVVFLIEDKGSGTSLAQDLKRQTTIPVMQIVPKGDKTLRFSASTSMIESGRVFLPEQAPWLVDFESQLCQFPLAKYDDIVDSTSQFLNWVDKPRFVKDPNLKYWK